MYLNVLFLLLGLILGYLFSGSKGSLIQLNVYVNLNFSDNFSNNGNNSENFSNNGNNNGNDNLSNNKGNKDNLMNYNDDNNDNY